MSFFKDLWAKLKALISPTALEQKGLDVVGGIIEDGIRSLAKDKPDAAKALLLGLHEVAPYLSAAAAKTSGTLDDMAAAELQKVVTDLADEVGIQFDTAPGGDHPTSSPPNG